MCSAMQTSVVGLGNLKTVVSVSGYGNIGDGPKSGKTLANMCHLAEMLSKHVPFQNMQRRLMNG
jgi:hypothetical protein